MSKLLWVGLSLGWGLLSIAGAAFLVTYTPAHRIPDSIHIVAHTFLFGVLSYLCTKFTTPSRSFLLALLVGAGVELTQGIIVGRMLVREAGFDMGVNLLGVVLGLIFSSRSNLDSIAVQLGTYLHPLLIGTATVFGLSITTNGSRLHSFAWTSAFGVGFLPAILTWIYGARSGAFDVDIRDRQARVPLFGLATLGCTLVALWTAWWDPQLRVFAAQIASATSVLSLITVAGKKMSGHVGAPAILAAITAPITTRGTLLLLALAGVVSWARIRAQRHTLEEVAIAWGVALCFGIFNLLFC